MQGQIEYPKKNSKKGFNPCEMMYEIIFNACEMANLISNDINACVLHIFLRKMRFIPHEVRLNIRENSEKRFKPCTMS